MTRLGQIGYRKKPKLSSKATGVKIKLARIFKSLRYCLAKKKKGLIHSLVKSVTKRQILKNLCQCLTARANRTCYVALATGQRDLPTMPDCKGQRNMLRRVGNRAARQKTPTDLWSERTRLCNLTLRRPEFRVRQIPLVPVHTCLPSLARKLRVCQKMSRALRTNVCEYLSNRQWQSNSPVKLKWQKMCQLT